MLHERTVKVGEGFVKDLIFITNTVLPNEQMDCCHCLKGCCSPALQIGRLLTGRFVVQTQFTPVCMPYMLGQDTNPMLLSILIF